MGTVNNLIGSVSPQMALQGAFAGALVPVGHPLTMTMTDVYAAQTDALVASVAVVGVRQIPVLFAERGSAIAADVVVGNMPQTVSNVSQIETARLDRAGRAVLKYFSLERQISALSPELDFKKIASLKGEQAELMPCICEWLTPILADEDIPDTAWPRLLETVSSRISRSADAALAAKILLDQLPAFVKTGATQFDADRHVAVAAKSLPFRNRDVLVERLHSKTEELLAKKFTRCSLEDMINFIDVTLSVELGLKPKAPRSWAHARTHWVASGPAQTQWPKRARNDREAALKKLPSDINPEDRESLEKAIDADIASRGEFCSNIKKQATLVRQWVERLNASIMDAEIYLIENRKVASDLVQSIRVQLIHELVLFIIANRREVKEVHFDEMFRRITAA